MRRVMRQRERRTAVLNLTPQPFIVVTRPVIHTCQHCGYTGLTVRHLESGATVWLLCFLLMFMGLVAGCCLIPFCLKGLQGTRISLYLLLLWFVGLLWKFRG